MSTAGSSTLRERIAALQQRGVSPQPTSSPRTQISANPSNAAGTALRDKIARFEQKGGTPIPRGSFGLGAPLQSAGKRNNELWGNRIPSAGRPSGIGTDSADRAVPSPPVHLSGGSRSNLMVEPQSISVEKVEEEHGISEGMARGADMVQSLDTSRATSTSSSSSPRFLVHPTRTTSPSEESNIEPSSQHELELAMRPVPPARNPPLKDEANDDPSQLHLPPGADLNVGIYLNPPQDEAAKCPPASTSSVITLKPPPLDPRPIPSNNSPSFPRVEPNIREFSSSPSVERTVVCQTHIPPQAESLTIASSKRTLHSMGSPSQSELSGIVDGISRISQESEDNALDLSGPSLPSPLLDETSRFKPVILSTLNESVDVQAPHVQELNGISKKDNEASRKTSDETVRDCLPPTGDLVDSSLLATIDIKVPQSDEPALDDVACDSGEKCTVKECGKMSTQHGLRPEEIILNSPTSPKESETSTSMYGRLSTQMSRDHELASHSSAVNVCLSTTESVAEISGGSQSHVMPILDAFPAVPKFLPPSSLPARARTISGRPRAADRMSTSSSSSTKSTPSLSFSPTPSSSSSPTSAINTTPHPPHDSRRSIPGPKRSKSQTRQISSVPAWYDDDSDDGEAGWANVIVSTRRY